MANKPPVQKKTFEQIRDEWDKIQTLDAKQRYHSLSSFVHAVRSSYDKKSATPEQLTFYMQMLTSVKRMLSDPQKVTRFLSALTRDWLVLTGQDKAVVVRKVSGKVTVESGTIVIADPGQVDSQALDNGQHDLSLMNQGKCFIFRTGADGIFNVQLRMVDALEPVLTEKEYSRVIANSETAIIHIPNSLVKVSDVVCLQDAASCITMAVSPGNYKICVYQFYIPNKLESFYVVLCPTSEAATNHLVQLNEFGFTA